jgi:outer membrane protein assembly factor BamB
MYVRRTSATDAKPEEFMRQTDDKASLSLGRRRWTGPGLLALLSTVPMLFAGQCMENGIIGFGGRNTGTDETDNGVDPGWDIETWPPIADEYCNGIDDDGDGLIDEGFPDLDEDGIADCIDGDCNVHLPAPTSIGIEPSCSANGSPHDTNPWDVAVEWQWDGMHITEGTEARHYRNVLMAPIVGNLTDDNQDGKIDRNDIPEVITVAFVEPEDVAGYLVALDGETGEEVLRQGGWLPFGGIVVADIDNDGNTEIVGFDPQSRPRAIRADGTEVWTSRHAATSAYPQATVADLDGDGRVEVLADNLVLDGASGEKLFEANIDDKIIGRMPAVGDIDLDGLQEFVIGQEVWQLDRRSGTTVVKKEWTTPIRGEYGHWSAILDANGDAFGEVAMIGAGRLVIHRHDGSILVDVAAGTDQPGPPCIADFDGDGVSELAWGSSTSFNVYELDGTKVWTFPMTDQSGLAGCSGYDFNADGSYEILFADEKAFYIFDGKTGQILYGNLGHASGTVFEYPIVADTDRDGSAEVIIASSNYRLEGWAGITVLGQVQDAWAKSGPTWHVHDFAVTNITEDGGVPANPEPSWQIHNVYRARPTTNELFVDLQSEIVDVCFSGCKGDTAVARLSVRIFNTGSSTSRSQVPIALYARSGDKLELLKVQAVPGRVPAGKATAGILFEVPATSRGTDGFMIRVNDDGSGFMDYQEECDLDNNEAYYADSPCPDVE